MTHGAVTHSLRTIELGLAYKKLGLFCLLEREAEVPSPQLLLATDKEINGMSWTIQSRVAAR